MVKAVDWLAVYDNPITFGKVDSLSALKGHPVLINFFSSDCINCRRVDPVIKQIYRHYEPGNRCFSERNG
jgi:thiol-disulfide isomerase/thioredoxin